MPLASQLGLINMAHVEFSTKVQSSLWLVVSSQYFQDMKCELKCIKTVLDDMVLDDMVD